MNPPSTKSTFSTGHSMPQCQQNSVMCSVCNCSRFLRFSYLENEAFAQELPFLKNVLKLSILQYPDHVRTAASDVAKSLTTTPIL